jgi:hypothetical protein
MAANTSLMITKDSDIARPHLAEIFTIPSTDVSVERRDEAQYPPSLSVNDETMVLHYRVPAGPHWLLMNNTLLTFKAKIVYQSGRGDLKPWVDPGPRPEQPPAGTDQSAYNQALSLWKAASKLEDVVAPINGLGQTLWDEITIATPTQRIVHSGPLQSYQAHMHHLLTHTRSEIDGKLSMAGWTEQEAGKINNREEKGFVKRMENYRTWAHSPVGRWVSLSTELIRPVFDMERPFVNYIDLHIVLRRASDDHVIMNLNDQNKTTKYKILIKDVNLHITRILWTPSLELATAKHLKEQPIHYPTRHGALVTFTLAKGVTYFNQGVHTSIVPKIIYFTMVKEKDFGGDQTTTPFNYDMEHVRSFHVEAAGRDYPDIPIREMQVSSGNCKAAYMQMLRASNQENAREPTISFDAFCLGGQTVIGQCLTNEIEPARHFSLMVRGPTRLVMAFKKALPENYMLVLISKYENTLQVNDARNIFDAYMPN